MTPPTATATTSVSRPVRQVRRAPSPASGSSTRDDRHPHRRPADLDLHPPPGRRRTPLRHRAHHGGVGVHRDLHRHLRDALGHLHPRGHVDGHRRHRALARGPVRLPQAPARRPGASPGDLRPPVRGAGARPRCPRPGLQPLGRFRPAASPALGADEAGPHHLRGRLHHEAPRPGLDRPPDHRTRPPGHRCGLRADPCPARHGDGDGPRASSRSPCSSSPVCDWARS